MAEPEKLLVLDLTIQGPDKCNLVDCLDLKDPDNSTEILE